MMAVGMGKICGLGSEVLKPTMLREVRVRWIRFCDSGPTSSLGSA